MIVFALGYNCVDYEPEEGPSALVYRMRQPRAVFNIFRTAKITVVGCESESAMILAYSKLLPVTQLYISHVTPEAVSLHCDIWKKTNDHLLSSHKFDCFVAPALLSGCTDATSIHHFYIVTILLFACR